MEEESEQTSAPAGFLDALLRPISIHYVRLKDLLAPQLIPRWVAAGILLFIYALRVWLLSGWYIVTYALGIYLLNQLVLFLMPQWDPEEVSDDMLPTRNTDEFKPFMRRLPEFRFWQRTTASVLIGLFCTFFRIFNIPVYWPILLIYFIILTGVQMKQRIVHMLRHRYIPFNVGKPRFPGKTEPGK
eukprot:TRINITY_DN15925_c0_g1_i1.p1 TRINITY_DN15925_c0_g1~~TRINITY_DN15925_c0_g1_i1.p1  ORF type:complete len:186 (+),score=29.68 TRINITY_DN15925_c0_g1_i1:23-580(+)